MTDNEVLEDGRILFVSPVVYGFIRDLMAISKIKTNGL